MAKKVIKPEKSIPDIIDTIVDESLENILGDRYAAYAKDVIQDRAIPDLRDGLKPVQRRIIFSMHKERLFVNKPRVKCGKVVGSVMGNYHPHGDSSIYEALVRMGQSWVMSTPFIDFQGNNGSIDGDPAAASRYTEARLSEISNELVRDLDKKTVNMQFTYDDTQLEPMVLPSRFPNLLINGSSGIGVGFATQIPPHNFHEIIEAAIYKIQHPKADLTKLREFVLGPDFPTGGTIINGNSLDSIYESGVGRIEILSKYHIHKIKDTHQIVITEIPYNTKKQDIVFEIDKLVHGKSIDGMLEVRDESSGDSISIVIDLKPEAKSELIVNYLIKSKLILSYFSANMVCIDRGRPRTIGLVDYLEAYIEHQVDVILRRSQYDLKRNETRLNIVEGLITAIINIEEVIRIIRASKSKKESKERLMERFKLNALQVEAILMMPLYKLNNTDVLLFETERDKINDEIKQLRDIISNRDSLNKVIVSDLREISKKYKFPRKTIIEDSLEVKTVDERDLIAKEEVAIALSRDGYIKRSSLRSYNSSLEGNNLPGVKSEDVVIYSSVLKTTDYLLAFTSLGNYLYIPVHQVADGKWKDEGKHINYLITLSSDEKIVKAINVSVFRNDLYIGLISARGQIKKTPLNEFTATRYAKPITCMRLAPQDFLVDAHLLHGNDDIVVIADDGRCSFFNETEVAPTGIRSGGIKAMSSLKDTDVVGFYQYNKNERSKIAILTDHGFIKLFEPHQMELTKRLGRMQDALKTFKSDPHKIICIQKLPPESKNQGSYTLNVLHADKSVRDVVISEFYLTPMDKYAKTNLPNFTKSDIFIRAYVRDSEWVGKSTKSEGFVPLQIDNDDSDPIGSQLSKTKPAEQTKKDDIIKEEKKEKKSSNFESLSIFDLMGD